jgi:hypothetical protein
MWIQHLLVVFIVLAAGLSATWRLSGNSTRLRWVTMLKSVAGTRGPVQRLAVRLETRLRAQMSSGCSNCGSDH